LDLKEDMVKKRGKRTGKSTSKAKRGKSAAKPKRKPTKKAKGLVIKRTLKRSSRIERLKSVPPSKPIVHTRKRFEEKKPTKKLVIAGMGGKGKHKLRQPNYGVRLVIGYTAVLAILYLIYFIAGLIKPSLVFIQAENSMIIDAVLLIWVFGVLYGFHERKAWACKFAIGWYAFMILYSIVAVHFIRKGAYNISTELFSLAILSIILINLLIIWYLNKKKDYFTGKDHGMHYNKEDKIFVYTLVCFWVLLLALSTTVGMKFYSDTKGMTNNLMIELDAIVPASGFEGGVSLCNAKGQPEKDVCFVILTSMSEGRNNYCDNIESQIYKFTCQQAAES
jgi:hypothetical protein